MKQTIGQELLPIHTCTFQFWPGYICTDAILDPKKNPEHHYNKANLSKGPMKNHVHKNNGTMEQWRIMYTRI